MATINQAKAIAKENGQRYFQLNAATFDEADFMPIPHLEGGQDKYSHLSEPRWVKQINSGEDTLVHLAGLDKASEHIKATFLDIMYNKNCFGFDFDENITFVL